VIIAVITGARTASVQATSAYSQRRSAELSGQQSTLSLERSRPLDADYGYIPLCVDSVGEKRGKLVALAL
jgi:hypothetical protein